jgi:hypothetical protein
MPSWYREETKNIKRKVPSKKYSLWAFNEVVIQFPP